MLVFEEEANVACSILGIKEPAGRDSKLLTIGIYTSLWCMFNDDYTVRMWMRHYNEDLEGIPSELATTKSGLLKIYKYTLSWMR